MDFIPLITLGVTMLAFMVIWLIHVRLEDAGIVDYYWGPGYAVIGWLGLYLSGAHDPLKIVFLAAVTVWAVRLAAHLIARHAKMQGEDPRYRKMRENGGDDWWWKSLFKVFILQALILWVTAAPVHSVIAAPDGMTLSVFGLIGLALFLAGFAVEWIADAQLAHHRAKASSKGEVLSTGLWAWCRHPNYLGEIIVWTGLAIVAIDLSGSLLPIIAPVLIALIIRFVSLPLTEQHLQRTRPEYAAYAARVPALMPSPPRRNATAADPLG